MLQRHSYLIVYLMILIGVAAIIAGFVSGASGLIPFVGLLLLIGAVAVWAHFAPWPAGGPQQRRGNGTCRHRNY